MGPLYRGGVRRLEESTGEKERFKEGTIAILTEKVSSQWREKGKGRDRKAGGRNFRGIRGREEVGYRHAAGERPLKNHHPVPKRSRGRTALRKNIVKAPRRQLRMKLSAKRGRSQLGSEKKLRGNCLYRLLRGDLRGRGKGWELELPARARPK